MHAIVELFYDRKCLHQAKVGGGNLDIDCMQMHTKVYIRVMQHWPLTLFNDAKREEASLSHDISKPLENTMIQAAFNN